MTQAEWNARVAARGDCWQYFKCDESSGYPQDTGDYGNAHMTAGTITARDLSGPFSGAEAMSTDGNISSPVYTPSPALDVNFGHPKTMEGWFYVDNTPSALGILLGTGNIAVLITTSRTLQLVRLGVTLGPTGTTVLALDTWYYVMLTSFSSLGLRLFIDSTAELEWDPAAWPVPNPTMLNVGQFVAGLRFSNLALFAEADLEPDLDFQPFIPQIIRYGR